MLKMQKYRGQKADFYIQSHGYNAGRPLREPIRNCFAVWTDIPNAFAIIDSLYIAKIFKSVYIHGTAIPFISLREIRPFLLRELTKCYELESFKKLDKVVKLETIYLEMLKQVRLLKIAYAQKIIKVTYKS